MNGETKTYIDLNESGKIVLATENPVAVYTYLADTNCWSATVAGTAYYLGTYSTYTTVSGSKLSYITAENTGVSQFPAGFATIEVIEDEAHEHSYKDVVTAPTCTKEGFTTHSCSCGDSYVDTKVEATGHSYTDGLCVCGLREFPEGTKVADFESFTKGDGKDTSYVERENADGWKVENGRCDEQAAFGAAQQIIINGKTTAIGKVTSGTLTGGIKKLYVDYGYAFSESNGVSIKINIKSTSGEVLATTDITNTERAQNVGAQFVWTLDTAVEGEFVIEIVNNCPSNSTSNKDRYSLWNLAWENV